jgi:hypothetical protein
MSQTLKRIPVVASHIYNASPGGVKQQHSLDREQNNNLFI